MCEGDGALVKEDMGRSEKMDESEEDEPLVLALLGSEEREREGVESAEEEAAAETAAEMVVILSGPASRREAMIVKRAGQDGSHEAHNCCK